MLEFPSAALLLSWHSYEYVLGTLLSVMEDRREEGQVTFMVDVDVKAGRMKAVPDCVPEGAEEAVEDALDGAVVKGVGDVLLICK
jgi:hypothetical protein